MDAFIMCAFTIKCAHLSNMYLPYSGIVWLGKGLVNLLFSKKKLGK